MEKEDLKTIHEKDLKAYLEKIGVFASVEKNETRCEFCNETITLENIYALFPNLGQVKFVCDKPICIKQFSIYIREKRYVDE